MGNQVFTVTCVHCLWQGATKQSGTTFLCARKFACPECGRSFLYPMAPGYRTFLWVLIALTTFGAVRVLLQGGFPIPGVFAVLAVIALALDASNGLAVKSAMQRRARRNQRAQPGSA